MLAVGIESVSVRAEGAETATASCADREAREIATVAIDKKRI